MISNSIELIILFGILGFLINWWAFSKGFYTLPTKRLTLPVPLKLLCASFAMYLGFVIFVIPFFVRLLQYLASPLFPSMTLVSLVQLLLLLTMIFWIWRFFQSKDPLLAKKVIKNSSSPIYKDVAVGVLTWGLSFPAIVIVGQFFDLILYMLFGVESYEQVPVRYFKESLGSFSQIVTALLIILVLAPIIEEFLFRGCLQNYLKKTIGIRPAILLASFCFALFHFSFSQGLGNISLIASLFVFACFLGFIYEKKQSLYASIGLHMTFNLISTVRILISP